MGRDRNHNDVVGFARAIPGGVVIDWAHLSGATRQTPGGIGDFAWRFFVWPEGDFLHFEIKPEEERTSLTPAELAMQERRGLIVVTTGEEAMRAMNEHSVRLGLRPRVAR